MQTNLPYNSQSSFPIGFRFAPFDDEIIVHYLLPKVTNQPLSFNIIEEVNVYKFDPQTLSEQYVGQGEDKWYFFSTREKVNKKGGSNNKRTTGDFGFWRVTDSPHSINHEGLQIGSKTTLVYYRGKSSDAKKTNWIMHEFEAKSSLDTKLDDIVVCRIYERKASNTRKRPRVEEVVAEPQPTNQIPNNSDNYVTQSNSLDNMHQQLIYCSTQTESHPNENMVQSQPWNQINYAEGFNNDDGEGSIVSNGQELQWSEFLERYFGDISLTFSQEIPHQTQINNNFPVESGPLSSSQLDMLVNDVYDRHHQLPGSNQEWN